MGNTLSVPILLVIAIFQATFVPQIRLLGGSPDFMFLVVLSWSINAKLEEGIVWAFMGGILLDLLSAAPTGTSIIGMLMIVFFVAGLGQQVYRIGFIPLASLTIVGTIVTQLTQLFAITLAGFHVDWGQIIGYVILPTLVYNLLMIWPTYWFVRRIQLRISKPERNLTS